MPIKIRCACGNILLSPEERVGQTGRCPACNRAITVELPAPIKESAVDTKPIEAISTTGEIPKELQKTPKPSWLVRLVSLGVYLFFILLSGGIVALHVFTPQEILSLEISKSPKINEIWTIARESFLVVRNEQRHCYTKVKKFVVKHYESWTTASGSSVPKVETPPQNVPQSPTPPIEEDFKEE